MKKILILLFFFISFLNITDGYSLSPTSTVIRNLNSTKPSESSHSSNRVVPISTCSDPVFEKIINVSPKLKVNSKRKEVLFDFSSKNIEFLQIIPKDKNHSDIIHDSDIQSICGGVKKYVNKYIYGDFNYQGVDKTIFFYRDLGEEIVINDFGVIGESQLIVKLKDSPIVFELNVVDSIPIEGIPESKGTLYSSIDLFTISEYYSNEIISSFSFVTSSGSFSNNEYSLLVGGNCINYFEKDNTIGESSEIQKRDTTQENSLYKTQKNYGNNICNITGTQGLKKVDLSNAINLNLESIDSLSYIERLEKRFDMFEDGDYQINTYSSFPKGVFYLVGQGKVYKLDTTNTPITFIGLFKTICIILVVLSIILIIIFILKVVIDKINKYIEKKGSN